jgi:hypothetical protein
VYHLTWVNAANKSIAMFATQLLPLMDNPNFDPRTLPHVLSQMKLKDNPLVWRVLSPHGQANAIIQDDGSTNWHSPVVESKTIERE